MKLLPPLLVLLLAACAHDLGLMKRDETLNAYRATVRWGPLESARKYQSERARSLAVPLDLEQLRISGYEVTSQTLDKERMTLSQTVKLRYYRSGNLVERETVDEQLWRYDDEQEKWLLDSPLPRFP
jgi:hypothetical protein